MQPIEFIDALRKSDEYIEHIYTEGGCYQFHLVLKMLFPTAVPLISVRKDHIVSDIEGTLYDIRGVVTNVEIYRPLRYADCVKARKWSFCKNNLLKITECPFCEEPICFRR